MAAERYSVKKPANVKPVSADRPAEPNRRKSALAEKEKMRRREAAAAVMRRRREKRANFLLILVLGIIFTGIYYLSVKIRIDHRPQSVDEVESIKIFKDGEKDATKAFSAEEICFNGSEYLPITFFNDFFEYTEYGDEKTYSFMLPESGEWASFNIGTVNALINGQSIALSNISFIKDGTLYLPIDFFHSRMDCFSEITYSSSLGCNIFTVSETASPKFYSKKTESTPRVDKSTIPQVTEPAQNPAV